MRYTGDEYYEAQMAAAQRRAAQQLQYGVDLEIYRLWLGGRGHEIGRQLDAQAQRIDQSLADGLPRAAFGLSDNPSRSPRPSDYRDYGVDGVGMAEWCRLIDDDHELNRFAMRVARHAAHEGDMEIAERWQKIHEKLGDISGGSTCG